MRLSMHLFKTAVLVFSISPVFAQNPFTIKATLGKDIQGNASLSYVSDGKVKTEYVPVKNGVFQFKGETGEPSLVRLAYSAGIQKDAGEKNAAEKEGSPQTEEQSVRFYLEKGTFTIKSTSDLKQAVLTGGKSQSDYMLLLQQQQPATKAIDILRGQMKTARAEMNDTLLKTIQTKGKSLTAELNAVDSLFIKTHPDSYVAYDIWKDKHRGVIDPDMAPEFMHFSKRIQQSIAGKFMAEKIATAERLDVGKVAPDLTLSDMDGKPVSLSSLKGKNVLLVFWYRNFWGFNVFSFNLSKVNRQLKDKNMVILAVSYDKAQDWLATLVAQSMNYINVTDEGGINQNAPNTENAAVSTVAKAYGLTAIGLIPQGFLIGTDGKIIARHLDFKDTELASKLGKLLVK